MTTLQTVCILAGGRGSRLGPRTASTPKPLTRVAGRPFIVHQLELLAANGANEVVLCVGHLGEQIEAQLGSEQAGIQIAYSYDGPELDGTLGAIRRALPLLPNRFLVLYGDTYLQLDYRAAAAAWVKSGLPAMMTVLENDGRWGQSNALFAAGRVLAYDKMTPRPEMRWIDYGLGGVTAETVSMARPGERDLSTLQQLLAERHLLFGFEVSERFYEIGSPEALAETEAFLSRIRPSS